AARSLGVEDDFGAVAPGRVASLALVEDLASFRVARCYARGRLVAEDGRHVEDASRRPYRPEWSNTFAFDRRLDADDFALDAPDGRLTLRVIGITPGSLLTKELLEELDVRDGGL